MTVSGYPLWLGLLIGLGVFFASLVDAIAGGGGIISVPVYLLAGLPPHQALGTNKMSACIGTSVSAYRYVKQGYVTWSLVLPAILLAMAGSHLGTRIQLMVPEVYLKYLIMLVLILVSALFISQKSLPEERGQMVAWRRQLIVIVSALVIGAYDGFYGPGTGTFLILVFCRLAKLDIRTASGNTKLVNLASNISGLATALMAGKVLIGLGIIAAIFSIAGHYVGSGLTIKNGSKIVRPVIFVVLGLLALKIVIDLIDL